MTDTDAAARGADPVEPPPPAGTGSGAAVPAVAPPPTGEPPPTAVPDGDRPDPPHPARAGLAAMALGALGIVFGDIGTSPLYAMRTVFAIDDGAVRATPGDVYGVVSLIFWSIMLVVTAKYVTFVLRADNDGEGGIMALAALVRAVSGTAVRRAGAALVIGVLGAGLFYGDSLITPAISVLSAIEGLEVVDPDLSEVVLPIGVVILTVLFGAQRFGTHLVGRLFGPVMVVWFVVLALLGLPHVLADPGVLAGLSPTYAGAFLLERPGTAFVAMGAVVLVITGAEALYADMGHFGRRPIRLSWYAVVLPALVINYLGQAALILADPRAVANPFYLLAPSWARLPLVVLATLATVIASQAVISGAFSVSQQAMRLGFLPHLTVRHTSSVESGQIYVPAVNWLLFGGVLILMAAFGSSDKLATAYGLAVTGTLLLTTTLLVLYAATGWRWPRWRLVLAAVVFGGVELIFFGANLTKVVHGGWLPLLIATAVVVVMMTWQRGRRVVSARRVELEGGLADFVERMQVQRLTRVPGTAVFPHPTNRTAPLALRANVEFNHVLHEQVLIVSVLVENVGHVPQAQRLELDDLGHSDDGISHLTARFGFRDVPDIPAALRLADARFAELDVDPDAATYFLSRLTVESGHDPCLSRWRKRLFIGLAHNAASPATYFMLPPDRTVVMGSRLLL